MNVEGVDFIIKYGSLKCSFTLAITCLTQYRVSIASHKLSRAFSTYSDDFSWMLTFEVHHFQKIHRTSIGYKTELICHINITANMHLYFKINWWVKCTHTPWTMTIYQCSKTQPSKSSTPWVITARCPIDSITSKSLEKIG